MPVCTLCSSDKTGLTQYGKPFWIKASDVGDGKICTKCHLKRMREIYNRTRYYDAITMSVKNHHGSVFEHFWKLCYREAGLKSFKNMFRKTSEATKQKQREAKLRNPMRYWLGKKRDPETNKRISEANKGKPGHNKGKHASEQTKALWRLQRAGTRPPDKAFEKSRLAWKGSKHTTEARAKIKAARARQKMPLFDTKIELMMQDALTRVGIKFKTHKAITGQPDIFIEPNICIFCDGDFWHANPKFIEAQAIHIRKNMKAEDIWKKDVIITNKLTTSGYKVLRFWESDIHENVLACLLKIQQQMVQPIELVT